MKAVSESDRQRQIEIILEREAKKTREAYGDIIDKKRPTVFNGLVSDEDRAAQFAPFAALTGYHESVEDTESDYSLEHETGGVISETYYE